MVDLARKRVVSVVEPSLRLLNPAWPPPLLLSSPFVVLRLLRLVQLVGRTHRRQLEVKSRLLLVTLVGLIDGPTRPRRGAVMHAAARLDGQNLVASARMVDA